jgi:hypothetical protein
MQRTSLGFAAAFGSARPRRALGLFLATAAVCGAGAGSARGVVVFGQLDDFEDGTTQGWIHAAPSPNPPSNIATGGPQGADDNYLQNVSTGAAGAGSRHVVFNQSQWAGDFNAAGVTRVSGFMRNFGPSDLAMRVGLEGGTLNTRFVSAGTIALAANGAWQPVTFDLTPSRMTVVAGSEDLAAVLANVTTFRFLSAVTPSFMGDVVAATLGADDLRAMTLPGDANFDGVVNLSDFNVLASNFGTQTGATWQRADFNFDGVVNLNDFNLLAGNFGQTVSGPGVTPDDWAALGAAVPEPASCLAAGLGVAAATLRQRRCRRGT